MSDSTFQNVSVDAKANVYFDGRVISHTVHFPDASKKSLGLIYPGKFHFGTAAPERMQIVAGKCHIVLDGTKESVSYEAGNAFDVAGNSGFTISVADGICEYICSYLPS